MRNEIIYFVQIANKLNMNNLFKVNVHHLIEDCRDLVHGFPTMLERSEPCSQHSRLC